ncbi:FixH family protein [Pseudidiomarina aestuarii]|uniref:FixH family protein n=1 Tax=Pseudidiomarina aestuarii TaxID=624146 RepID=UPI003A96E3B5
MTVKPWYKQFWPWFLMGLPFSVIIAMIITLTIASQYGDNPMVVDDYYKKGRGINVQVEKVQVAQQLNISFSFQHTTEQFTLAYASGAPAELTALRVSFYHSTLSQRDFEQVVTADAEGVFRGQLPAELEGKWTVTVTPFDNAWRLSQSIQLPTVRALTLKPLTYGV